MRYEIGVSVEHPSITWAHGPWPARTPDVSKFRAALRTRLIVSDEMGLVGNSYTDFHCLLPPGPHHRYSRMFALLRARYEILNRSLKHFNVLASKFRQHITRHAVCFRAVLNTRKLMLVDGPLFDIR